MHSPLGYRWCAGACIACVSLAAAQPVTVSSAVTVGPTDTTLNGVPLVTADITVQSGGVLTMNGRHTIRSMNMVGGSLTHAPAFTHEYGPGDLVRGLHLTVTGNMTVGTSALVNLRGRGEAPGRGPAPGIASFQSGGGHGGNGGPADAGGAAYGDLFAPVEFGSGGFAGGVLSPGCIDAPNTAGRGGGCLRLIVGGVFSSIGPVVADGANFGACSGVNVGGGAGGSLWITCATHAGSGAISAHGGQYGGAGGRIRIDAGSTTATGSVLAYGGRAGEADSRDAGAGTVVRRRTSTSLLEIKVLASIGGAESETPLPRLSAGLVQVDRAIATLTAPSRVDELSVSNSGTVTTPVLVPLVLDVVGNLNLTSSGRISATGRGYPAGEGPGAGNGAFANSTTPSGGGGGGGDGRGGNGSAGGVGGQGTQRDIYKPAVPGSGGGPARAAGTGTNFTRGGAGGGVINIDVGGGLLLLGTIEANGQPGQSAQASPDGCMSCLTSNTGSGGGGGGSVTVRAATYIEVGASGAITAEGAASFGYSCVPASRAGGGCGGGGGGGTVAVYNCASAGSSYIRAGAGFGRPSATTGSAGLVTLGSGKITIASQPQPGTLFAGGAIVLSVAATTSGPGSLTYQWRRDGQALSDAGRVSGSRSPMLTITGAQCADTGVFDVILADSCGAFPSDAAAVAVLSIADFNADGGVDGADVETFFRLWETGESGADVNADGGVDGADVEVFFVAWQAGGC